MLACHWGQNDDQLNHVQTKELEDFLGFLSEGGRAVLEGNVALLFITGCYTHPCLGSTL